MDTTTTCSSYYEQTSRLQAKRKRKKRDSHQIRSYPHQDIRRPMPISPIPGEAVFPTRKCPCLSNASYALKKRRTNRSRPLDLDSLYCCPIKKKKKKRDSSRHISIARRIRVLNPFHVLSLNQRLDPALDHGDIRFEVLRKLGDRLDNEVLMRKCLLGPIILSVSLPPLKGLGTTYFMILTIAASTT